MSDIESQKGMEMEFRHYHPEMKGDFAKPKGTIITREYPSKWEKGDEPYYPIGTPESSARFEKYRAEVDAFNSKFHAANAKLIVGGRLGSYKYHDMDKSIEAALNTVQ